MAGLLPNAPPCPDAFPRGRMNKKLSPTSRKRSPHGSGRKIRRPFPATHMESNPKFSFRSNVVARLANISGKEPSKGLPEGGMAGNRSSRKPSRTIETRTARQPFDSAAQRIIGRHSSRAHPQCRNDRRGISGSALGGAQLLRNFEVWGEWLCCKTFSAAF